MPASTLRCRACWAIYYTALTGRRLASVAQRGCESCGSSKPLGPRLAAVSATVKREARPMGARPVSRPQREVAASSGGFTLESENAWLQFGDHLNGEAGFDDVVSGDPGGQWSFLEEFRRGG